MKLLPLFFVKLLLGCLLPLSICLLISCNNTVVINQIPAKGTFSIRQDVIGITQVNFDSALYIDSPGYAKIDFQKFGKTGEGKITKKYNAVVLENDLIRLTLLPERGKPYSFIYKVTGNEEFFIPEIAQIQRSPNKTGWWFMLGGAEYVMPDEEHGETWAAPWKWEIVEDSPERKSVKMSVDELRFGLKESIVITVFPDKAYYEAEISITNPTDSTVKFQHWINPMWVPGGDKNGLTPNTEFIIPTKEVYVTERTFNKWMLKFSPGSERLQQYDSSPMRFFKNWEYYGDLLAWKLEEGYYSAFSHEKDEGIVRVFPFDSNPGCNIWTFGYDPDTTVRKRFSGTSTHNGYVEMWGGITPGFKEFYSLEPGKTISWVEWMYPYFKTSGLHYANRDFAVTFHRMEPGKYKVNFCPSGLTGNIELKVKSLSSGKSYLDVKYKSVFPENDNNGFEFSSADQDIELIISGKGEELARLKPEDYKVTF